MLCERQGLALRGLNNSDRITSEEPKLILGLF